MTTYTGSCHCKQVRFEVTADVAKASTCNCSICSRVGWTMFSVEPSAFKLLAGDDAQTDYQFNTKSMHHLFCKTCGVHAYGRWEAPTGERIIVNAHCLDGLDAYQVPTSMFDGKSY